MDEVIRRAGLRVPNRLHRVVAECTGLHPTTVLRYHRQELESADARVLECIQDIEVRVQNGENLFLHDEDAEPREGDHEIGTGFNVSVHELNRWFERLKQRLGCDNTSILYQYIEDELGIAATTVMRYHSGELRGAPATILHSLRNLDRVLCAGEPVVFRRGPGENGRYVPRSCVDALIAEIEDLGLLPERTPTFEALAVKVGLKDRELEEMLSDESWPFVRLDIYEKIKGLRDLAMYDPRRHYEVGDRIWFPDLGTGTVMEKLPKERMRVFFDAGVQRLLREDVWVDPRAAYPLA
jgi:hypothetical protein